jgi:hypothetical protein
MASKKELMASAQAAFGNDCSVWVEQEKGEWVATAVSRNGELLVMSTHASRRVATDNVLLTLERIAIR